MRLIKSIFPFFMLFLTGVTYSQSSCIRAGDLTLVTYTDISPDAFVSDCCYQPPDTLHLDLNNDNKTDFHIVSWYRNSIMGSYGYSYIVGVDENTILVNDTNNNIADTLSSLDSICIDATWKNKGSFIDYHFILGDSVNSYSNTEWNDLQDKYVGLKLKHVTGAKLGWVQIYAKVFGSNYLQVKDYACGSSIPPIPVSSEITFFPNPTTDFVNIYLPNDLYYEVNLINNLGEVVYHNYGSQKFVDMSAMPSGVYVLSVKTNSRTINEKIIKTKQAN